MFFIPFGKFGVILLRDGTAMDEWMLCEISQLYAFLISLFLSGYK